MSQSLSRTRLVVDASVAAKWVIEEPLADEASRLRSHAIQILAPGHMRAEVSNALWKRQRRGDITPEQAQARVALIATDGVIHDSPGIHSLLPDALDIAIAHNHTIYDALYVALAISEGCQFVTADRALYNSLAAVYPDTMLWIEDVP